MTNKKIKLVAGEQSELLKAVPKADDWKSPDDGLLVYLAGPFFNRVQIERVNMLTLALENLKGVTVFSPMRDGTVCPADASREVRKAVYDIDVGVIKNCDLIVAILDDKDTGTTYEMGYAAALRVPVIGLAFQAVTKLNLMLAEGFHAFEKVVPVMHDHIEIPIISKFCNDLVNIKLELDIGLSKLKQKDLALSREIKDAGLGFKNKAEILKKESELFDQDMSELYHGLEKDYDHTLFGGPIE